MYQSRQMGGPVKWKVDRQTGSGPDWWTGEVASGWINRYRQTQWDGWVAEMASG